MYLHRRRWLAVAILLAVAAVSPTAAVAFRGHEFGFSFGEAGPGNGQFKEPSDVAVNDATGQVYVLDQGNARIERFSAAGKYEAQFDGSETPAKSFAFFGEGILGIKGSLSGGIAVDNACFFQKLSGSACTAMDPSNGDVYVTDPGPGHAAVDKFSAQGKYLGQLNIGSNATGTGTLTSGSNEITPFTTTSGAFAPGQEISGPGIPAHTTIVLIVEGRGLLLSNVVAVTGPEPLVAESKFTNGLSGVAVDQTGRVYVKWEEYWGDSRGSVIGFTDGEPNVPRETPHGILQGEENAPGFAVAPSGELYVRARTNAGSDFIEKLTSNGAEGLVVPFWSEEASAVAVNLANGEVFLDNLTSVGAFSPEATPEERLVEEGGAKHLQGGAGLAVANEKANPKNTTVYVADAVGGVVDVFPPEGPGAPIVQSESTSVSEVTSSSASFGVEVDPHGADTGYVFEYGPCETGSLCTNAPYTASVPVPDGLVGSDFEFRSVGAEVQDLVSGTVYHVRVVAHNEARGKPQTVFGEERSFTTQTVEGFGLPDGRAWEMVSPAEKRGALLFPSPTASDGIAQASVSGGALTYTANAPTEAVPQGYSNGVQVFSTRGPDGWVSRDLTVPHVTATSEPIGNGKEYRFFSKDLSLAFVQPFASLDPAISEEASEQTAFLHTNFLNGNPSEPCVASMPCYRPLVSASNTPEGTVFGEPGLCPPQGNQFICGPEFLGATSDASHVVLASNAELTEDAPNGGGLYEWSAGALQFVGKGLLGHADASANHAIANGGSRVFFEKNQHLYVRDVVKGETLQLDVPQEGASGGTIDSAAAGFQSASPDGSLVFFTGRERLTKNSGAASTQQGETRDESDLYECRLFEGEEGKLHCGLTDLTPAQPGGGADVLGAPVISEDGSYIYFVANGVLAEGAQQGDCPPAKQGQVCNLYMLHFNGVAWESPRLIARLAGEDKPDWETFGRGIGRVSPDGGWFAFMSQRSLTGYDNRDARSGKPDEEVYLYDASTGALKCASCDPTGARPDGEEIGKMEQGGSNPLAGGWYRQSGGLLSQWLAADIPAWTHVSLTESLYQSRYLSDTGRLFFNAHDALSPHDVDGTWDVYEYEPPGVGNCHSGGVGFSERSGGCVGLISAGTSSEESAFMDASENGDDVFFLTASKLSSQDFDTSLDIYDAHECSTLSPCLPEPATTPPPCVTEASCKAAPTPQPGIFGAPPSATFSGVGNIPVEVASATSSKPRALTRAQRLSRALTACRKQHRRSKNARKACEHRAKAQYARPTGSKFTNGGKR
jgi:hypothetical protein